jgi:glutathione S-transferase
MKLYGRYLSPFVRRVAVSLNIMQTPFEQVVVAPFDEWEKAQSINPVVRIPALEIDNGEVIIDSTAILDHLDEVAGSNSLLPQSGQPRREAMKLDVVASKTNGEGWLYGDKISQADISAVVALTFANIARPQMNASDKVPNLSKLAARLEATEAFQSTMP